MNKNQMNSQRTMWIVSAVVVGAMYALAIWAWAQLPQEASIPVHWGVNGEADRYGGKAEGLLLMPTITLFVCLLLAALPRLDPRGKNIMRSSQAYRAMWLVMLLFFLAIYVVSILAALGWMINMGRIMGPALGLLFLVLGNYMGKIRSNYTMGIRTPWTLASELSWNKTHRLGGKLFVVLGLLLFVSGLSSQSAVIFYLLIGGLITTIVTLFVYSYLVWKNDPTTTTGKATTA